MNDENKYRRYGFNQAKKRRLNNGLMIGTGNSHVVCNGVHQNESDMQKQRRNLPIFPVRWKLIQEMRKYNNVIVIGETGSGKTTQIPQFLFEAGLHKFGIIGVTQPRRVAAITISSRVAKEMSTSLGETVGYCVRFEDMTSGNTKIKYLTDGMLLREAMLDSMLRKYSVIILDEAHERTLHTDVLFGVVKSSQSERKRQNFPPLKLIIMSATMDVDHFSAYFNNAPVLYLEGRQFPVKIMYTNEPQDDYIFSVLVTIFQIHQTAPPQQDILVFLTGQDEIESLTKTVRHIAKSLTSDCPMIRVCPLYAALPSNVQLAAFQPTPNSCRKVILATNIAETSITISGIKFVIDAGMVKARTFNPSSGLDMLKVQRISKAQSWQRSGRAGRESSGVCYRTYTESEYEKFREFSMPEIQRCNLSGIVLELLVIGVQDLLDFDFMDKPSTENIASALDQLQSLGAVEKREQFQLTPVGRCMSSFPLDPRFSKILLASKELNCTDEVLSIIALFSVETVMHTPNYKREEAAAAHRKFISSEGDHITALNVYKAYRSTNGNKHWCHENYVHQRNLQMASDIRKQLLELCSRAGLPAKSCGTDTSAIRKCLISGLFLNSAELQRDGTYLTLDSRQTVCIHPSSVLFQCKPAYVIFTELIQTTKCYMRNLSVVDPDWLKDIAPPTFHKKGKLAVVQK